MAHALTIQDIKALIDTADTIQDAHEREVAKNYIYEILFDITAHHAHFEDEGVVQDMSELGQEVAETLRANVERLHDLHALELHRQGEAVAETKDLRLEALYAASALFTAGMAASKTMQLVTSRNVNVVNVNEATFAWMQFGSATAGFVLSLLTGGILGPILLAGVPALSAVKNLGYGFSALYRYLFTKQSQARKTELGFDALTGIASGAFHGAMAVAGLSLSLMALGYVTAFGALSVFMATPAGWATFVAVATLGVIFATGPLISRTCEYLSKRLGKGAKEGSLRARFSATLKRWSKKENPIKKWWNGFVSKKVTQAKTKELSQKLPHPRSQETQHSLNIFKAGTDEGVSLTNNTCAYIGMLKPQYKESITAYISEKRTQVPHNEATTLQEEAGKYVRGDIPAPPYHLLKTKNEQKLFGAACLLANLDESGVPQSIKVLHRLKFDSKLGKMYASRLRERGAYQELHEKVLAQALQGMTVQSLGDDLRTIVQNKLTAGNTTKTKQTALKELKRLLDNLNAAAADGEEQAAINLSKFILECLDDDSIVTSRGAAISEVGEIFRYAKHYVRRYISERVVAQLAEDQPPPDGNNAAIADEIVADVQAQPQVAQLQEQAPGHNVAVDGEIVAEVQAQGHNAAEMQQQLPQQQVAKDEVEHMLPSREETVQRIESHYKEAMSALEAAAAGLTPERREKIHQAMIKVGEDIHEVIKQTIKCANLLRTLKTVSGDSDLLKRRMKSQRKKLEILHHDLREHLEVLNKELPEELDLHKAFTPDLDDIMMSPVKPHRAASDLAKKRAKLQSLGSVDADEEEDGDDDDTDHHSFSPKK